MENTQREILYLFCFGLAKALEPLSGTGIDGNSPLFLVIAGEIGAVCSTIHPDTLQNLSAESGTPAIEQVTAFALRHESVIEQTQSLSPVFPVRFGSLFSSSVGVERVLWKHRATIAHFLEEVEEAEEWAVKGYLDRERAVQTCTAQLLEQNSERLAASPGRRYLEERRLATRARQEVDAWLEPYCHEIAQALQNHARQLYIREIVTAGVKNEAGHELILNWAFLVPQSQRESFAQALDTARQQGEAQGLSFSLTGPWPPYSFCPPLA